MTTEQILEDLFEKGWAEQTFNVSPTKTVTLRTLSSKDQLDVENMMSSVKGAPAFVIHTYSINLLSKTLSAWNGRPVASTEEALKILEKSAATLVQKLVEFQRELDQKVAQAVSLNNVEKTFSQGADVIGGSQPSPEE